MREVDQILRNRRVTGDHDRPVRSVEPEAVCRSRRVVIDERRRHAHVAVLPNLDWARQPGRDASRIDRPVWRVVDVVDIEPVVGNLEVAVSRPIVEVCRECLSQIPGHAFDPRRRVVRLDHRGFGPVRREHSGERVSASRTEHLNWVGRFVRHHGPRGVEGRPVHAVITVHVREEQCPERQEGVAGIAAVLTLTECCQTVERADPEIDDIHAVRMDDCGADTDAARIADDRPTGHTDRH